MTERDMTDPDMTTAHRVLWVSAHPSEESLTVHLRDQGIAHLRARGTEVVESDLYAMGWDPVLAPEAFARPGEPFHPVSSVRRAYLEGHLPDDIAREQEKLRSIDALVLQFPLWWYGMPALMKGWFDRVFHSGFAFGTDPASGERLRFENGPFRGVRALTAITLGDRPGAIGPRGKSGEFHQLMFGLLHGTLAYTGLDVLPPFPVPGADHLSGDDVPDVAERLRRRLDGLYTDPPIAYRPQFTSEYTEEWELADHVRPGESGLDVHIRQPDEP